MFSGTNNTTDGKEDESFDLLELSVVEKEATELGCQLMGEGFVISVGLALLWHQVRLLPDRLVPLILERCLLGRHALRAGTFQTGQRAS